MRKAEQMVVITNKPKIDKKYESHIRSGWKDISHALTNQIIERQKHRNNPSLKIVLDGYIGTDWDTVVANVKKDVAISQINVQFFDVHQCLKSQQNLEKQFEHYLGNDSVFGKLYKKSLKSIFDSSKIAALKKSIQKFTRDHPKNVAICFGTGASFLFRRKQWSFIFYFDLSREESLKRNKQWMSQTGTQSISPKKLYYIDFQVNDKHRNHWLSKLDFYIDGNDAKNPVMISGKLLEKVTAELACSPFALKYLYEPGPWGGQWLKKIRNLPEEWMNCAWSYEVIAQEQSLLVALNNETVIDIPWTTFLHLQYDRIMGNVNKRRFDGQFPIRYDYLDTMDGGDLSIQVHPPTPYIQRNFAEPYHQGEMYYIVDTRDCARVNLGLNADAKKEEFYEAARLADEQENPFDYRKFVNSVPVKKHDLLLIPPGTVHGSGEGIVVLEISSTTYRYTFKIYDHLRPDLNGVMRPIHVRHAFNVIKWFRRKKWVDENLKQQPRLVRSGDDWAEYLIGDRREFFHIVFRMDFDRQIIDETDGQFHVLCLVQGESVLISSLNDPEKKLKFDYSETIIVPACFGGYSIVNLGDLPCKIAKARLR